MSVPVILVEAMPRGAGDGLVRDVALAGGGADVPYPAGYRAGVALLPTISAMLDFSAQEMGGGGVPQAAALRFAPASADALAEVADLYWTDAAIAVRIGGETDGLPPVVLAGTVLEATVANGGLQIALADPAAELKRPVLVDRFAGTGGVEGPAELAGVPKARSWGRCFNVAARPLDPANNIYCFGDPSRRLGAFDAVRDRGALAEAASLPSMPWQGSVEATFAALQAAEAPTGGGVISPDIACIKWWTEPGDLTADLRGEAVGGYVETAAEIVERLVSAGSTIGFTPGTVAAAVAARPGPFGWRVEDESTTTADALSAILGDVSTSWLLAAGLITLRPWSWSAPVTKATSFAVTRRESFRPVGTRKLGYRRNWHPVSRGDLAAIVLVTEVLFPDGSDVLSAIETVAQQVDRGAFDATVEYRTGNIVSLSDGSRWRFDAITPATGETPIAGSTVWTLIQAPTSVIPPATIVGGTRDPVTGAVTGGMPAAIVIPRIERIPAIETAIERIPALDAAVERIPAIAAGVDLLKLADIDQQTLTRQVARESRSAGTASLAAVVTQYGADKRQKFAAAQVREETFARIDAGDAAEAGARLLLTAQVGDVDARLANETLVRASETGGLVRDLDAMSVTIGDLTGGITRLDEAVLTEVDARTQAVSSVRAELTPMIDAAAAAAGVVDTRLTAEVGRLDLAVVEVGMASAEAVSGVRAELVPLIDAAAAGAGVVNTRVTGEVARLDQAIVEGDAASARAASSVRAELVPLIDAAAAGAGVVNTRLTGEVLRLDEAIVEGDAASARAASSVRAELVPLIDAAASGAGAVNTRLTGEVARLDQAIVEGNAASAQAASSVRADLVPLISAAAGAAGAVDGRVTSEVARLDRAVVDEAGARARAVADVSAELDGKIVVVQDRADAAIDATGRILAERTIAIDVNGNIVGAKLIGSNEGPGVFGLFNADLKMGEGRIICQSATHMTVSGIAFGTTGQFLEWYGPLMPIAQCAEGNGIAWKRRDGKAYTRGALIAGTISNAVQTSSTALDAEVTTGVVGSNGGQRIVVVSYSLFASQNHFDTSPSDSGVTRAVVVIRRNGQDVDSLIVEGSWQRDQSFGSGEPGSYRAVISGAKTFYDNSGGQSVSYSARLMERDDGPGVSSGGGFGTYTQSISIVQSED